MDKAPEEKSAKSKPEGAGEERPTASPALLKRPFIALVIFLFAVSFGLTFLLQALRVRGPKIPGFPTAETAIQRETRVEQFKSEDEFKQYLTEAESGFAGSFGLGLMGGVGEPMFFDGGARSIGQPALELGAPPGAATVDRVSETTVQVKGIDEPDIVKTDGRSIFYSSSFARYLPMLEEPIEIQDRIAPSFPRPSAETKIIKAFPPADLARVAGIDKQGDLLLADRVLVIFSGNEILGYDVSDPKSPSRKWTFELEGKNQIVASRLYQNRIYIVAQTRVSRDSPCPIPLRSGMKPLSIPCREIYHPIAPIPVDSTFSVLALNPQTGDVDKRVSFVGSSGMSIVYMSSDAIYVTYTFFANLIDLFYNFFSENPDLISQSVLKRIDQLRGYDISAASKFTEFGVILEEYYNSLSDDERLRIENEMQNRMETYMKAQARDLQKTGIAKIKVSDLSVVSTGGVPGVLLNQFSLDEYQDHLRVATTVSGGFLVGGESENDVYVLDQNLRIVGQVQGLGLTERIYSVRFVADKGFIVTFRQIDPFYVLDLSNPTKPQLKGELKIPGYSSYLHPITRDRILGVGKEGAKVKVSLFDVGSAENPREASKYMLDETWSDILNTHHAFLLDTKHVVFFLPGSRGGYVFSYRNDDLRLLRAVSDIQARRAIFINDYMYIIGDDKIVVLNEIDWEEVNRLSF